MVRDRAWCKPSGPHTFPSHTWSHIRWCSTPGRPYNRHLPQGRRWPERGQIHEVIMVNKSPAQSVPSKRPILSLDPTHSYFLLPAFEPFFDRESRMRPALFSASSHQGRFPTQASCSSASGVSRIVCWVSRVAMAHTLRNLTVAITSSSSEHDHRQ